MCKVGQPRYHSNAAGWLTLVIRPAATKIQPSVPARPQCGRFPLTRQLSRGRRPWDPKFNPCRIYRCGITPPHSFFEDLSTTSSFVLFVCQCVHDVTGRHNMKSELVGRLSGGPCRFCCIAKHVDATRTGVLNPESAGRTLPPPGHRIRQRGLPQKDEHLVFLLQGTS